MIVRVCAVLNYGASDVDNVVAIGAGALRVLRASTLELEVHEARLEAIAKSAKKPALWRALQA